MRREPAEHISPWLKKMPKAAARRGTLEVGDVGHHDVRRLAAALEPDALHVGLAGVLEHALADAGRAGEGDAVDVHVQRERLARRLAEARHDVQHALRKARFHRELRDAKRRERRLLGGLQHDGIAGRERRARASSRPSAAGSSRARSRRRRRHGSRVMSASDSCAGRRDLVVDLVDRLGVPGDAVRGRRDVDLHRVRDRLAHVQRLEQRELLAVLADQLGEAQQHLLARGRRAARPGAAPRTTLRALATASSTSAASQEATCAMTWPFAGLMQSKVAPETAGTYLPSMKACVRGVSVLASAASRPLSVPGSRRCSSQGRWARGADDLTALAPAIAEAVRHGAREIVGVPGPEDAGLAADRHLDLARRRRRRLPRRRAAACPSPCRRPARRSRAGPPCAGPAGGRRRAAAKRPLAELDELFLAVEHLRGARGDPW